MAKTDAIVGRYIHLTIEDVDYRVYFEESGSGIPLICQHGGGGEGMEWRHLLNDPDITAKYRVIVPDLPYHGKSLPPEDIEWWKQEYQATKGLLFGFYLEFIKALGLERPVYIGNAIGASLGLDMGLEYPDLFRAVIAHGCVIKGGKAANGLFYHPEVTNTFKIPFVMYFCSPFSPEKDRRLVTWCAMQTAVGENGDLYYYNYHDLTDKTDQFDTSRCAIYLLTSDYNPTSSYDDTIKLSSLIKGSKLTQMKGMSLVSNAENPPVFKSYLMPILEEISGNK